MQLSAFTALKKKRINKIVAILRNARRSLAAGGRLVVKDFFLAANRRQPRYAGLFTLNMLVSSESGGVFTEPEFRLLLGQAGFRLVKRFQIGQASSVWVTRR